MRKNLKNTVSFILSLVMLLGLFAPVPVSAAGADKQEPVITDLGYKTMTDVIKDKGALLDAARPSGEVYFIVELEGLSLLEAKPAQLTLDEFVGKQSGLSALSRLALEQSRVKKAITQLSRARHPVTVEYSYTTIMNGFSVRADYSQKADLEAIPGVRAVYLARSYELSDPPADGDTAATSGAMINSDRANQEGFTGKGVVTAVLDTGLDITHDAFSLDPASPSMALAHVEAFAGRLNAGASASDLYKSAKIPFAYDYADSDADVSDKQSHGTHVAGTVAARSEKLAGVAPDSQLAIMKVFSDHSSGANDAWIFAALEDAVLLNVDVINMSLGSPSGFTRNIEALSNRVYDRIKRTGISLMVAAGNDRDSSYMNLLGTDLNLAGDPDNSIVGSPSVYPAALSVASVNERILYVSYMLAGGREIRFNDTTESEALNWSKALEGEYDYVAIPYVGSAADYAGLDVEGKVALVRRGEISFVDKEANAKAAGAVAIMVSDNVEGGDPLNMQTGGLLPMVSITKADGDFMRGLAEKRVHISKDNEKFMEDLISGGLMSDFSSLGVAPDLSIKPEITAPGGNVYSTLPGN